MAYSPVLGFSQAMRALPKAKASPGKSGGTGGSGLLPAASTPFPRGSLEARREVCRTVHGSGMLDVEMCE